MKHQLTHLLGYYRVQRQNKYNCLMDIAKQERNFYIDLLVVHILLVHTVKLLTRNRDYKEILN